MLRHHMCDLVEGLDFYTAIQNYKSGTNDDETAR